MFYMLPAATVAMLGYVFWRTVFRLRKDRLLLTREQTRGKFALRPRDRLRLLLNRSFTVADDKPDWEEPLVAKLAEAPLSEPAIEPVEAASQRAPTQ
jgi:hypothetical protein